MKRCLLLVQDASRNLHQMQEVFECHPFQGWPGFGLYDRCDLGVLSCNGTTGLSISIEVVLVYD
jgi:hypothetical protein